MKRILSTLAALVVAAVLSPASAQTVLRVGDQKGGSRALMEAAGVLADLPYRLEWSEFPAAAPLLEALNAGAIDTGIAGDAPFTFAAAAGAPIKAIFAIRQNQGGLAVLVKPDSPAQVFTDLRGKRIATGRGSIGHELLLAALEEAGLKPSDVKLTFLLPADARVALITGSIDAWATWEPYTSQLETSGAARVIKNGRGITPGLTFQPTRIDAIATKRPALEDFVRRLAKARVWGTAHPEAFAATWSKLMSLPEEVPLAWFKRANILPVAIDENVVSDLQSVIDLYQRNGLIPRRVEAGSLFDTSFNAAAAAGAADASR